jgi:hypothetical protein
MFRPTLHNLQPTRDILILRQKKDILLLNTWAKLLKILTKGHFTGIFEVSKFPLPSSIFSLLNILFSKLWPSVGFFSIFLHILKSGKIKYDSRTWISYIGGIVGGQSRDYFFYLFTWKDHY